MTEPFLIRVASGEWIDPSKIVSICIEEGMKRIYLRNSGEVGWVQFEDEYWPNLQEFIVDDIRKPKSAQQAPTIK